MLTEEEVKQAFLTAPTDYAISWQERSFLQKLCFWKEYRRLFVSPDILELTLKNPNWFKNVTEVR